MLAPVAGNAWPCRAHGTHAIYCGASEPPFNQVLRAHESVQLRFTLTGASYGIFDLSAYARPMRSPRTACLAGSSSPPRARSIS